MKSLKLLLILILFTIKVTAQSKANYSDYQIPTKNGNAFYETVDTTSGGGKSKDQIYAAARKAFTILYSNSKNALEIDDKADAHIMGKGTASFEHKIQLGIREHSTIKFTIDFQAKDNKFRIQIFDFSTHASQFSTFSPLEEMLSQRPLYKKNYFQAFDTTVKLMIEGLRQAIKNNLEEKSDF